MPDGQLCLLALPPECSAGGGSALPYLKLCCRYFTDRKVRVLPGGTGGPHGKRCCAFPMLRPSFFRVWYRGSFW